VRTVYETTEILGVSFCGLFEQHSRKNMNNPCEINTSLGGALAVMLAFEFCAPATGRAAMAFSDNFQDGTISRLSEKGQCSPLKGAVGNGERAPLACRLRRPAANS
jgi:hypothetical protein